MMHSPPPPRPEGFYNVPPNPFGIGIAKLLEKAKGGINETFGIPGIDIGIGLGDMIFGESPELMFDLSHGADLWKGKGFGGRLDSRAGDIAGLVGLFGTVPNNLIKTLAKGSLKNLATKSTRAPWKAQKGYIVTPNSPLFDKKRLIKAKSLQTSGASVDEIWEKTRTWLNHKDGLSRQEIAHGDETYLTNKDLKQEYEGLEERQFLEGSISKSAGDRMDAIAALDANIGLLKDRLIDSPMEKHDPVWFNKIKFEEAGPWEPGLRGSWRKGSKIRPSKMMIDNSLTPDYGVPDEVSSMIKRHESGRIDRTVRHEGGHAFTGTTGRSGGGQLNTVPNYIHSEMFEALELWNKMDQIAGPLNVAQKNAQYAARNNLKVIENLSYNEKERIYKALSDESQSRLIEYRWHMSQGAMDNDAFYKKYPVPPEDMIYLPGSLPPGEFSIRDFLKQVNKHLDSPDLILGKKYKPSTYSKSYKP